MSEDAIIEVSNDFYVRDFHLGPFMMSGTEELTRLTMGSLGIPTNYTITCPAEAS